MDTTKAITHVSLCAGYGGIDLGLKRAIPSLRTIAFSEIESFACANLVSKMEAGLLDPAPIWTDLKTFPWSEFHGCVDILSGGYPCQPFSAAGKRLGAEDPRHLWPFIAAGIAAMRPGACFFENVEGHISLGLPDVLQDLAGMGYRTTWGVASASECGAPHQRKRIFILAECSSQRGAAGLSRSLAGHEGFAGIADDCGGEGCGELEHAQGARGSEQRRGIQQARGCNLGEAQADWRQAETGAYAGSANVWPSRPGEQQFAWEPPRVVADTKGNQRRLSGDSQSTAERWWSAQLGSADGAGAAETSAVVDAKSQRAGQRSELRSEECGSRGALPWDVEQSDQAMGNANELRSQGRHDTGSLQAMGISRAELAGANGKHHRGPAESSLGGNSARTTHRLDDAVLHVSTDNRTDELRLLGNGVVPACAERAFRVLVGELMEHQP